MGMLIFASLVYVLCSATIANAKRYREWEEDFERMGVGSQWEGSLDHPELTKIIQTSMNGKDTKVLEVKYLKDKFGSESRVRYKVSLVEGRAYALEFDVKFGKQFDFSKGGKLPGLCGGSCTTGCKNITADGWSSRFLWKVGNKLHLYIYDQDRDDGGNPSDRYCGTIYDLNYNLIAGSWIKLKQEVRINSPGRYDGSVKVWANGIEIYRNTRIRWRGDTTDALINLFYFTTFFGGSTRDWAPSVDSFAYFDNFHVSQA